MLKLIVYLCVNALSSIGPEWHYIPGYKLRRTLGGFPDGPEYVLVERETDPLMLPGDFWQLYRAGYPDILCLGLRSINSSNELEVTMSQTGFAKRLVRLGSEIFVTSPLPISSAYNFSLARIERGLEEPPTLALGFRSNNEASYSEESEEIQLLVEFGGGFRHAEWESWTTLLAAERHLALMRALMNDESHFVSGMASLVFAQLETQVTYPFRPPMT